jgi:hypothetical protein
MAIEFDIQVRNGTVKITVGGLASNSGSTSHRGQRRPFRIRRRGGCGRRHRRPWEELGHWDWRRGERKRGLLRTGGDRSHRDRRLLQRPGCRVLLCQYLTGRNSQPAPAAGGTPERAPLSTARPAGDQLVPGGGGRLHLTIS